MTKKQIKIIIALFVIVTLTIYVISKVNRHSEIEACIKKGGTWNTEQNKCETARIDTTASILEYYWHTTYDSITNREFLEKGKIPDSIVPSVYNLIEILNRRSYECKIKYIDQKNDTLYIKVLNDELLTEQMGTTGAQCYLGETVLTLLENDSIHWIHIDIIEGSHARPGVYSKNDFNSLLK